MLTSHGLWAQFAEPDISLHATMMEIRSSEHSCLNKVKVAPTRMNRVFALILVQAKGVDSVYRSVNQTCHIIRLSHS